MGRRRLWSSLFFTIFFVPLCCDSAADFYPGYGCGGVQMIRVLRHKPGTAGQKPPNFSCLSIQTTDSDTPEEGPKWVEGQIRAGKSQNTNN